MTYVSDSLFPLLHTDFGALCPRLMLHPLQEAGEWKRVNSGVLERALDLQDRV